MTGKWITFKYKCAQRLHPDRQMQGEVIGQRKVELLLFIGEAPERKVAFT